MNENKMDDITDCCINADDDYECFICDITFKSKGRFLRHLITKRHLTKRKKIGLCQEDIKEMRDLYERINSFYGMCALQKIINSVDKEALYDIIDKYSKKYKMCIDVIGYDNISLCCWENKINDDYTNYRISSFQIKNKETNEILTINYETLFLEGLLNAYTFYKDIKDFELKLICDIIFIKHIKYPKKNRNTLTIVEKSNSLLKTRIARNEIKIRLKLKHYIYFDSPYWSKDVGSIIDSYI